MEDTIHTEVKEIDHSQLFKKSLIMKKKILSLMMTIILIVVFIIYHDSNKSHSDTCSVDNIELKNVMDNAIKNDLAKKKYKNKLIYHIIFERFIDDTIIIVYSSPFLDEENIWWNEIRNRNADNLNSINKELPILDGSCVYKNNYFVFFNMDYYDENFKSFLDKDVKKSLINFPSQISLHGNFYRKVFIIKNGKITELSIE